MSFSSIGALAGRVPALGILSSSNLWIVSGCVAVEKGCCGGALQSSTF